MTWVLKTCDRHMGCARHLNHHGACMGRRGNVVPAYKPIVVIEVAERDSDGIPVRFREIRETCDT